MMTERIRSLRQLSQETRPSITTERAALITGFYKNHKDDSSTPVTRALAFQHVLRHKQIYIGEGELIVGERGPEPMAAPTYPEINAHSTEDLEILSTRAKTSFRMDPEVTRLYREEFIPFWRGRSIRDRIFSAMDPAWLECFDAGLFTEFMEQRAPGHTVLDDKIYSRGLEDFRQDIREALDGLDYLNDPGAYRRREELLAMDICAAAMIMYARRHAEEVERLLESEADPDRRRELEKIAAVCRRVPARAPRDFWEALQAYWFVHLGVIIEYNTWDSFNPGRLDQHLFPFYQAGLEEGSLDMEKARELLQAFWIKFNNQPAPPKVGVTAAESGTFADFALINTGGLDVRGQDAVNELSYLILDVVEEMRLIQPSAMVQISKKTPDRFLKRALKIVKTGYGQPSIFSSDSIVAELVRHGKSLADARQGGTSGCVETAAFGKENHNLTGYFNLTKVLEITLNNGTDPRTGKQLGLQTGDPASFGDFKALMEAFKRQLEHFIDIKVKGNNIIERMYAEILPAPFLSLFISDCIAAGKDYHDGGARYNTSYIMGVGLGTITDALSALRTHVYEKRTVSMRELLAVLAADFAGHETLRRRLANKTPRYGNDDDAADGIMREVFEAYYQAIEGRPNTKGGSYHVSFFPTTCHVYFGGVIGATPDGRRAGQPLSEGISPVQGNDRKGPTAVIKSAAKMDHLRTGGTLLNQKLCPDLLADEAGIDKLAALIRGYFRLDGHHIQFNVVDSATLQKAKQDPDSYRDLIVRVAGYSDYFVDLGEALQDEIIRRTEQSAF
jgi:pyruvate formate-lyase/glycerol dehydratase family glycyl radical enzyme